MILANLWRRGNWAAVLCAAALMAAGCAAPLSYPRTASGPPIGGAPPAPLPTAPRRAGPPAVAKTHHPTSSSTRPMDVASAAMAQDELTALLEFAGSLVGARSIVASGESFNRDCSGLVRACYYTQGMDLFDVGEPGRSGTESIYRYIQQNGQVFTRGTPAPGDVVFFHNSYDKNRNGRRDDLFTHVALVESVDDQDTVTLIHVLGGGIVRSHMNLRYEDVYRDPQSAEVFNDYLRRADSRHPAKLASELFFSYGRLF